MLVTRRSALVGALALGATRAAMAGPIAAEDAAGLATIAGARGILFGSAIGRRGLGDPAYRTLVQRQSRVITPENALKWVALRPTADTFDFSETDRVVGWAKGAGLAVRGHTLLWPRQDRYPDWLKTYDFGSRPAEQAQMIVGRHVVAVVQRYASRIQSFDVVNEAVDPATGALRDSHLARASGDLEGLIDVAFELAHQAAPKAELVYNDYMDWGAWSEKHRAGVLRLLGALRKRGTPIHALGIQCHINADGGAIGPRERAWRAFLDEVTGMGYRLLVTEFDVDDRDISGSVAERDRAVADYARAYCDIILRYPTLTTFVTWGLSDRFSWLDGFMPRADGQHKRGCPFDDAFAPKPLRDSLAAAFAAAPPRAAR